MKRAICLLVVIVALLCGMTACNFTSNFSDSTGLTEMSNISKVEEMLAALAADDRDAALALMHPDVAQKAGDAVAQMSDYLAGRSAAELEQLSLQTQKTSGTQGNILQENAAFRVTLDDGTRIAISVNYVTEGATEGFAMFQIVLGVI